MPYRMTIYPQRERVPKIGQTFTVVEVEDSPFRGNVVLVRLEFDLDSVVNNDDETFLGYYPDGEPVVSVGGQVKHVH